MYPRKLLKELADNADKEIVEFLNDYRVHFPFCRIPILELYETVSDEILHGENEKSALRKLGNLERKKRKKNKQRWFEKLTDAMHNEQTPVSSHPFGSIILIYHNCSGREWSLHFNDRSLSDVLQDKYHQTELWLKNPSLPLVSYPAILSVSQTRAFKALKSDIAIDICHTIEEKYNGCISDFWHIWPNKIIDLPLFSPEKMKLEYTLSETGKFINSLIFGDGTVFTTSVMADATLLNPDFSFTELDMRIMRALFSQIDNTFIFTRKITCDLRTLINAVNPSAGAWYYEKVIDRLKKYPCYTYRLEDPQNPTYHSITFNIFDNISIQPDSTGHIRITVKPASCLTEQIINNQITFISRKEAECLSLPLSKILMFKIQRERVLISFLKQNQSDTPEPHPCHYSFFEHAARLPYRTKSENLRAIADALQEMADHNIFIRSFHRSGMIFYIIFYPLSKEEQEDFHISSLKKDIPEM